MHKACNGIFHVYCRELTKRTNQNKWMPIGLVCDAGLKWCCRGVGGMMKWWREEVNLWNDAIKHNIIKNIFDKIIIWRWNNIAAIWSYKKNIINIYIYIDEIRSKMQYGGFFLGGFLILCFLACLLFYCFAFLLIYFSVFVFFYFSAFGFPAFYFSYFFVINISLFYFSKISLFSLFLFIFTFIFLYFSIFIKIIIYIF